MRVRRCQIPNPKSQIQNSRRRVLVVGMARSGVASVELLVKRGAEVRATDLQAAAPEVTHELDALHVPFHLQSQEVFEGADLIVLSPGVPADLEALEAARRRGATVIGEVELASYFLEGPVIGHHRLERQDHDHCAGRPHSARVRHPGAGGRQHRHAGDGDDRNLAAGSVERAGAFQLPAGNHLPLPRADRGGLNVTPNHLDRHHTFEKYAAAKGSLFETQQPGDYAVLNADDPVCVRYAALTKAKPLWFSSTQRRNSRRVAARW